jgi:hypothetical protein
MKTAKMLDTNYSLGDRTRGASSYARGPLDLTEFFGENPRSPELCDQILRALANLRYKPGGRLTENEAFALGVLAFIYSYSAVKVGRCLRRLAHRVAPGEQDQCGDWNKLRVLDPLSPTSRSCLRSPDHEILHCGGAIDLSDGPVLLYTPDIGDRYFSYQFIDAHGHSFAYVGTRSTHGRDGVYAIVGPGWRGRLPKGLRWIQSLTPHNLMIGRIFLESANDTGEVREIYRRSTLAPIGEFRRENGNDADVFAHDHSAEAPGLSGVRWFEFANKVLNDNPPPACENELIALFAWLGFGPGFDFCAGTLTPNVRSGLERAVGVAENEIVKYARSMGQKINGWRLTRLNRRIRETNYIERAAIALDCLTQGSEEEIFYAECGAESLGRTLNGTHFYVLRFEKGLLLPSKGFWSLTSCEVKGVSSADDGGNRRTIGSGKPGIKYADDDSIEIYLQRDEPPPDMKSNWLRTPKGRFAVQLRLYIPGEQVLNGLYRPPPIIQVA